MFTLTLYEWGENREVVEWHREEFADADDAWARAAELLGDKPGGWAEVDPDGDGID